MAEITIDRLAGLGDGIAKVDGQVVFVANALPTETVKVNDERPHAALLEIITPSVHRVEPPCPHFAECGNCTLQHLAYEEQLLWKQEQVALAFRKEGLKPTIKACVPAPNASRRRVTFTARQKGRVLDFGFMGRGSHELVDIKTCIIAHRDIESHLPSFKQLCTTLVRGAKDIQLMVSACDNGLDLAFTLEEEPSEDMLAAFTRAFARSGFLRASINGDVIAEREKPIVTFNGPSVNPPAGGFLQAVPEAEQALADLVCAHLKKSKWVADLFCGSGTFALRLAKRSKVAGFEGDENAVAALKKADKTDGLKPVSAHIRDLDQLPLQALDLKPFDGICLDPPRAGAEEQVKHIAKSPIARVAYVSCNPATLARDSAILIQGGYKLESVTPVDQFIHSTHVEAVALFTKATTKAKRSIFR